MAEAICFFKNREVRSISLNTQGDNYRTQQLYGWFGFRSVRQEAVVLQKRVNPSKGHQDNGMPLC